MAAGDIFRAKSIRGKKVFRRRLRAEAMQNLASPSRSRLETGRRVQRWTVPGLYTWDLSPIFYFLSIHPCWLQGASSNGAPAASAPSSPIGQSCLWGGRGRKKIAMDRRGEGGRERASNGWWPTVLAATAQGKGREGQGRSDKEGFLFSSPPLAARLT